MRAPLLASCWLILGIVSGRAGGLEYAWPELVVPPLPPQVVEARRLWLPEPIPASLPAPRIAIPASAGVVVYRFTPGGEARILRVAVGKAEPSGAVGLIELFGGEAGFRSVLARGPVAVARLRGERLLNLTERIEYVELDARPASREDAAMLRALLTTETAYDWSAHREAKPRYVVRLKLGTAADALAVDVDFSERWLRVVRRGETIAEASFSFGVEGLARVTDRY